MLFQDKGHSAVVLKAMGRAINKTVTIGAPLPICCMLWPCSLHRVNVAFHGQCLTWHAQFAEPRALKCSRDCQEAHPGAPPRHRDRLC